ncbi:hypothetical protein ECZU06_39120 [Escherichia coli]|nr:hypothetical protein ECZU06_39120 [Escherichia coli]
MYGVRIAAHIGKLYRFRKDADGNCIVPDIFMVRVRNGDARWFGRQPVGYVASRFST